MISKRKAERGGRDWVLLIRATIFHCTSDLPYGIARMLQTLHQIANPKHKVIITKSEEELAKCIGELESEQVHAGGSQ